MARMTHILLNIADWHTDTARLSKRAKGCYIDFLGAYYRNGGPLPYDEHQLTMMLGYKNTRSLRVDLAELLRCGQIHTMNTPTGTVLVNNRSDEEIQKFEATQQGRIAGGKNGKPGSRAAAKTALEMALEGGSETASDTVSSRNGADISAISSRYQLENAPEIVENQRVSGNSSSILNIITTNTHAYARGPVAVPDPIPDLIDQPAPKAAKPTGQSARQATGLPPKPAEPTEPAEPKALRMLRGQSIEPPAQGTPEYAKWELRQRLTAIQQEIRVLCGDTLAEHAILHRNTIEAWIADGADVEDHIFPAVRYMVEVARRNGNPINGIAYFAGKIQELRDAGARAAAAGGSASSPAKGQYKSGGYGGSNGPTKPKSPVPEKVMATIKMARQNEWTELFAEMWELLKPANKGCEQSLRLLNDLHAKHASDVLVPHSVWLTQRQSSAA